MATTQSIERLVRELYGLAAIKRDTQRRAFSASAMAGLSALATVERLGPSRVSDIADGLHVDLSVASRQIAALAAAGHVVRERDAEDGRSHVIAITDAGRDALQDAHRRMVEAFSDAVEAWSDEDVVALAAGLTRLREDYAAAMAAEPAVAGAGR
jgi:DNA-binding MarR family transcriptional regulator